MRKVSIMTLSLVMLMNGSLVFSAPRKANKRRNAVNTNVGVNTTSATTVNATNTIATNTIATNTIATNTIVTNSIVTDSIATNSIASEELEVQNAVEELERDRIIEGQTELGVAHSNLQEKINAVKNSCSGIKKDLDSIFGLNVATTVSSGLGTLAAGGALVTGIMKAKTDKNIEEISKKPVSSLTPEEMKAELESIKAELDEAEKKSKTLGNVRTGLMAGSIATSAVSTGTSIASSINAKKLAQKMSDCNDAIDNLKMARSKFLSDIEDFDVEPSESSVYTKADDILKACKGYDRDNIRKIQTMSTASAVTSGIGTATSIAGTITSAMANSKNVRDDNSEDGVKKEKSLNIASNVMAGISTGTSGASTVLSAISISKAKKDSDMAEECENILK